MNCLLTPMAFANPAAPPVSSHARLIARIIPNSKVLLDGRQALPRPDFRLHHPAMLSAQAIAKKFNDAFPRGGAISDAEIAKECGIYRQAVHGWRTDGRIHKRHLAILARLSGRPLSWWLTDEQELAGDNVRIFDPRKFTPIRKERRDTLDHIESEAAKDPEINEEFLGAFDRFLAVWGRLVPKRTQGRPRPGADLSRSAPGLTKGRKRQVAKR